VSFKIKDTYIRFFHRIRIVLQGPQIDPNRLWRSPATAAITAVADRIDRTDKTLTTGCIGVDYPPYGAMEFY